MIEIPELKDYPPRPGEHPRRRWWRKDPMGTDPPTFRWFRWDGQWFVRRGDDDQDVAEMARIDRENPIPRPPYRAGQVWVNVINGVGVLCTATDVFDPTWAHSVDCRAVTDCPSMVLLYDPFGGPWAPAEGP